MATDDDKPTDLTEKTPIQTNLRTVGLAVAGVAVAVWYGSNWMGTVTSKLDTHSSAIQRIDGQLETIRAAQDENFKRLLGAIERHGVQPVGYERSMPASAPAASPRPE